MGTNIIGVRNKSIPALQCSGGEWHSLAWHEFYMARNLSTAITSQWLPSPLLFLASSSDESMEKVHRPGFPSHSDQSQTTKNQISHIALFLYVRGKIHYKTRSTKHYYTLASAAFNPENGFASLKASSLNLF